MPLRCFTPARLRPVAALFGAVFLAACSSSPDVRHTALPDEVLQQLRSKTITRSQLLKTQSSSRAPGPVTVPMRLSVGWPYVHAAIQGHAPTPLLLDTGADVNLLEGRSAAKYGVSVLPPEKTEFTVQGTVGQEPAWLGLAASVDIGAWKLRNIPCIVRTRENSLVMNPWEEHHVGVNILGLDVILRTCGYLTLDYPRQQAVFGVGSTFPAPSGARVWSTPLTIIRGKPYVTLHTHGQAWRALVDSGFSGLVHLDEKTAARLHLLDKTYPATMAFRLGLGTPSGTPSKELRMLHLPEIASLGPRLTNIEAAIVPDFSKIGTGLLRPFRVTLDFRRKLLWLEGGPPKA